MIKSGDLIITSSGSKSLPFSDIYHIVGPIWNDHKIEENTNKFEDCMRKILKKSNENHAFSLNFPMFLSFNFPREISAELMIKTVFAFLKENTKEIKIKEINFINKNPNTYNFFVEKFEKITENQEFSLQIAEIEKPLKKSPNLEKYSFVYKSTKLSVIQGNLTLETSDAIVNAANNDLWLGGGVAGAIDMAAGP